MGDKGEEWAWDQRTTLSPPPYEGAMKPLLPGLFEGDEPFDAVPFDTLHAFVKKPYSREQFAQDRVLLPPLEDPPEGVDWERVRRGQDEWKARLGPAIYTLSAALLLGFRIGRFSDVLFESGYASSPLATYKRFQSTGHAITDYYTSPLDDPDSLSRWQVLRTRTVHALARGRVRRYFPEFAPDQGNGVPLSQLDLVEVLMGFSVTCIDIMKREMRMEIGPAAQADMVYCWWVLGHFLGIKPEYNVCTSPERAFACLQDYFHWMPCRMNTLRESSRKMNEACVVAFGKHTVLGVAWWRAFDDMLLEFAVQRGWCASRKRGAWRRLLLAAVRAHHDSLCSTRAQNHLSRVLMRLRKDALESSPASTERKERVIALISWVMTFLWPLFAPWIALLAWCAWALQRARSLVCGRKSDQ